MEQPDIIINQLSELEKLFNESASSAYEKFDYFKTSRCVSMRFSKEMPTYVLDFDPYTRIATSCGVQQISLKKSLKTERFYLWGINNQGHAAELVLRPVTFKHVCDSILIKKYYENNARELYLKIEKGDYPI